MIEAPPPTARRPVAPKLLALLAVLSRLPSRVVANNIVEHAAPCTDPFESGAIQVTLPSNSDLGTMIELPLNDADGDGTVTVLLPPSPPGRLVTLSRVVAGRYAPIGRSYDYHSWENVAGPEEPSDLEYACCTDTNVNSDGLCQARLPVKAEYIYHLTMYDRSMTRRQEVARFLERGTFGPTVAELDVWEASSDALPLMRAQWVRDQIESAGTSSHREFFRKRLNPRSTEAYKYGIPGPKACEANSRWRRFAFTRKDLYMSLKERVHTLDVETKISTSGVTAYVLKFAGSVRTVINQPLEHFGTWETVVPGCKHWRSDTTCDWHWINNVALDMNGASYHICGLEEIEASRWGYDLALPRTLALEVDGVCQHIISGNPTVNLDPDFLDLTAVNLLDLSSLSLTSGNSSDLRIINEDRTLGSDLILTRAVSDAACDSFPDPADNDFRGPDMGHPPATTPYPGMTASKFNPDAPVFAHLPDGTYAIHDYRLDFRKDNTIENPLLDGGGSYVLKAAHRGDEQVSFCANAPQTPFNEDHCKLSYEPHMCEQFREELSQGLDMDPPTLTSIYDMAQRRTHAIDGLIFDASITTDAKLVNLPCEYNKRSRWIPVSGTECDAAPSSSCVTSLNCVPSIDNSTEAEFAKWIHFSNHDNFVVRDVRFRGMCHPDDKNKFGMVVHVEEEGQCFRNVHPDHMSIYDITDWLASDNQTTFDLSQSNVTGIAIFDSSLHDMSRWEANHNDKTLFQFLGRLGDVVELSLLPDLIKGNQNVQDFLGFRSMKNTIDSHRGGTLVCGSQGEIAPDPTMDDHFEIMNRYFDSGSFYGDQKKKVWTMLALSAPDQLRQRVAWALSQFLVVEADTTVDSRSSEPMLAFYDILVRNSLGNYRDVLREAAFHPKMGLMLTYIYSKSVAYYWYRWGDLQYPDENFSREVMQLFTIGLVKLNLDGSPQRDRHNTPIPTYDTVDVASLARVWTGFNHGPRRGNYEDLDWSTGSYMDPMRIDLKARDYFPKRGLDGTFIGDRYPLCVDLPERPFLRKGAKYRLLGGTSLPKLQEDRAEWDEDNTVMRVVLVPGESELQGVLCNADLNGDCIFPATVTLDGNLPCHGMECRVDTVRVVQVAPGVFYEYLRQPCVQLAFFEGGKKIFAGNQNQDMCANPKMPVAAAACCGVSWVEDWPFHPCEYVGERTTYDTYEARCPTFSRNSGKTAYACDASRWSTPAWVYTANNLDFGWLERYDKCQSNYFSSMDWASDTNFQWSTSSCSIKMVVNDIGLVALVHDPAKKTPTVPTSAHVSLEETINYFSIHWERNATGDEQFPSIEQNGCGEGACSVTDDGRCLCDTVVIESAVFGTMPTREEVLANLTIGAFAPATFDDGDYISVSDQNGVEAFKPSGASDFTMETIFKVTSDYGKTVYLKNMRSVVQVGGGTYLIRNPPHFMDIVDPELRDAYYETEAALDHYLYHDNTAPFVSKLLIQRFGIANPSPRYIKTVASAFQSGSYQWTDGSQTIQYGDSQWGSLAATIAAILLDREATSSLLDADPSYGALREPLLKVIGFMRSMEYMSTPQDKMTYPILHSGTRGGIGQMVYEAPDVFSFFSPDYTPCQFSQVSLVSPESQILNMKTTVEISNGFFSLVRHGMTRTDSGFGAHVWSWGGGNWNPNYKWSNKNKYISTGNFEKSVGYLGYSSTESAENIVDELSTLLTSGRLSEENKQIIELAYNSTYQSEGADMALRVAQQLITTTPEFHSTNLIRKTGGMREPAPQPQPSAEPYKAIVYVFMFGGMDSFYMLSPHSSCADLYQDYEAQRGNNGKLDTSRMLPIDATTSDAVQPCDTFGLNNKLPILKEIYDAGNGLFLANTGHLSKPVSKFNYFTETRTQLFSHHSMEREAYYVDAFRDKVGTGVLGRMLDVLEGKNYSVGPIGIDTSSFILDGDPGRTRRADVIRSGGADQFYQRDTSSATNRADMIAHITNLNGETTLNSGLHGNHWAQTIVDSMNKTQLLRETANIASLSQNFGGSLGNQLKMVSKLIATHEERGVNRDAFAIRLGGFDTHTSMKDTLDNYRYPDIQSGIDKFYKEMQSQGMLSNVTFVLASEFGRTITSNSGGGTDHGWGGNYFMFGGEVKGGRILGQYPNGFSENDPTNDGRGRLVPTTSWESVWNGIAQWFGIIGEDDLNYVMPNRNNFGCRLFTNQDIYMNGNETNEGCNGETMIFQQQLLLDEARYLTGEEQKAFCEALISFVKREVSNTTVKCVIINQKVEIIQGRRSLSTGGDVYALDIETEISTDEVGAGPNIAQAANKEAANITDAIGISDISLAQTDLVTEAPTSSPSALPSHEPSSPPSAAPSISHSPSGRPSESPSVLSDSSSEPLSDLPSGAPTIPPSDLPSMSPSMMLSSKPTTAKPSELPSSSPSISPSGVPSNAPSMYPSDLPSVSPSMMPLSKPTTAKPSELPSSLPSVLPSGVPSNAPSVYLSELPSMSPSMMPSSKPTTASPSELPSSLPSVSPSVIPSNAPSSFPSEILSVLPSLNPSTSSKPSAMPSTVPSFPSGLPPGNVSVTLQSSPFVPLTDTSGSTERTESTEVIPSNSIGVRVNVEVIGMNESEVMVDWNCTDSEEQLLPIDPSGRIEETLVPPAVAGVYSLCFNGKPCDFNVWVFDPDSGFVTAEGEFNSMLGSVMNQQEKEGVGTFELNARYQKQQKKRNSDNESVRLVGKFYFALDSDFFFSAMDMSCLVVVDDVAMLTGTGYMIDDEESHSFILTMKDGDTNGIRLQIQNIYDNYQDQESGCERSFCLLTQPISSGEIVIHKKNGKGKKNATGQNGESKNRAETRAKKVKKGGSEKADIKV